MKSFLEQRYHLKRDPFPSNVALPEDPMVGREKEFSKLLTGAKRYIGERTNSSSFVIGDYGTGKTLMLYKLRSELEGEKKVQCVFLKLLPEDRVKRFGMDFIQRVFARIDLPAVDAPSKALKDLAKVLPDEAAVFEKAFAGDAVALQILRGEGNVSKKEMEQVGTRRRISNTESAVRFWLSYLFLIRAAGIETIVLLIDEVEYLFSQVKGAAGVGEVFNTLRELHDLSNMPKPVQGEYANSIFFFAVSEDGWRNVNMIEKRESSKGGPMNPFLRRLSNSITLKHFTLAETKELIQERLSGERAGRPTAEPLIPFNEGFVKFVFEVSQGVPHYIVRNCHVILRQGLEEGIPLLTKDFAKKVLKDSGFYAENEAE